MTMTSIIIGSRLLITTEPNLSSKNTPTQCSGRFQKYSGLMSGSQYGGDMSAKLVEKRRSMIDANSDCNFTKRHKHVPQTFVTM